jgi:hypothetical protein
MHGATVSFFAARDGWIAGVAQSTSHVTHMMSAPWLNSF